MNMWLILSLIISLTRFITKGWDTKILEEIVDFRCDPDVAIPTGEKKYTNVNGIKHLVITTKVWDVKAKWIYQITDWVTLHLIKE